MAVHVKILGVLFLVMLVSSAHAAETAPKGVSITLPPFTSKFKCSIQSGIPDATTKNTCIPGTQGNGIFMSFSGTDSDVYSVRYQYSSPVQLWKKNSKYVASFSTSFTINIDQYTDEYSFIGGGGIAFAITPSISTTNTNAESLGLFPINPATGNALPGAKPQTVAVEIDISRNGESWDAPVPHLGLDINSLRSVVTKSLGAHADFVDHKLGVYVDYNAKTGTLQVRTHKVNVNQTPSKAKSTLAISYNGLDLATLVKDSSYVGFSTRVPKGTHGAYLLYDWQFTTTWVLGTKMH